MKKNKGMKRLMTGAAAFACIAMMTCACGNAGKSSAAEAAKDTVIVTENAAEEAANMPNPMHEVTREEMTDVLGIDLEAPAGAKDAVYYIIDDGANSKIAQLSFVMDGKEYTYRAQATDSTEGYDNTGNYFTPEGEAQVQVDYNTATLLMGKDTASMYWIDVAPGINYSLSCNGQVSQDDMTATAAALFKPVQGAVDGNVN